MAIMVAAPVTLSKLNELEVSLNSAIRGKPEVVRLSLVCLLARGHLLIEDVPGVGKTTLAQALARSVHCGFHRLQFTSDMLPSDVLGVTIYNAQSQEFEFKPGPVFTNFLLADEINRATPKTQSALLEAMNEVQVTIEGRSHRARAAVHGDRDAESGGAPRHLSAAGSQLDRFLMRMRIGYPERDAEREIVRGPEGLRPENQRTSALLRRATALAGTGRTGRRRRHLVDYMLAIVERTRSPRIAGLGRESARIAGLYRAAQALALVEGRDYAIPDDVKRLVVPVFAHRIVINARTSLAQRSTDVSERILQEILTLVEVPL